MRLKKKQKDFGNVAIKRVKSNALALALSSDSNIDEVNNAKHAKVLIKVQKLSQNVEFLEVALEKEKAGHGTQETPLGALGCYVVNILYLCTIK